MPVKSEPNLPEPSPELILLMAEVRATARLIERNFSKREAQRYLDDIADGLGVQEASYNVLKFRPRTEDAAVFLAMRQARAWWSQAVTAVVRMTG